MLYTKPMGKNAFHLLWTEITEVIFSMIKVALQQFREPKRHTTKRGLMTQKSILSMWTPREDCLQRQIWEFISNDDIICRIHRTFLGQLHFTRNYLSTANTFTEQYFSRVTSSTQQLLFESSCFFRAATFLEHSFLLSNYSFKIVEQ